MVKTIHMGGAPARITMRAGSDFGNDEPAIGRFCHDIGCHYNSTTGRWEAQARRVREILKAAHEAGIGVRPQESLRVALIDEADRLEDLQAHMIAVSDKSGMLYPFQRDGVSYLYGRQRALLFDDMGLGKTVQALMALRGPAIVCCPAFVKGVWAKEAAFWRPDLRVTMLGSKGSDFRLPHAGELLITNYERLPGTADLNKCEKHAYKGITLIFDEAHKLKSGKAKRTLKARTLAGRLLKKWYGNVWLLSGTPLQNKPQELWSLLVLLGLHKVMYSNYSNFADLFGGTKAAFGYEWDAEDIKPGAIDVLWEYSLRRLKSDVLLDLPSKTFRTLQVDPADDEKLIAELDCVDMELLQSIIDDDADLDDVAYLMSARMALALHKARQIGKTLELYEETDTPLVVFSAFKEAAKLVGCREGWVTLTGEDSAEYRTHVVAEFQAGQHKGISATIGALKEGVTLTRASTVIFIDRTFVPTDGWQCEDRLARIGQKSSVSVIDVDSGHPIEYALKATLAKKAAMIHKLIDPLGATPNVLTDPRETVRVLRHIASRVNL